MYVNVVTKLLVECNGAILPLHLPLKIPDHLLPHPDPHPVNQVQLIMHCLTAPPLLPPVGLKRLPGAIIKPELAIPDTKAVKPGSIEHPIIRVKLVMVSFSCWISASLLLWPGGGGPLFSNQASLGGFRRVETANWFLAPGW